MAKHPVLELMLPAILVTCLFLNVLGKDWHFRFVGFAGWISICAHYRIKHLRTESERREAEQRRMERLARGSSDKELTYYILAAPAKKTGSISS
jgi:hypothetical protein